MTDQIEHSDPNNDVEVTYLLPCLNEAQTIVQAIEEARAPLVENNVSHEILVADNGSMDGSQDLAAGADARVIHVVDYFPEVPDRGYGTGLQAGVMAARGRYIIMSDSDNSYDVSNLFEYVKGWRDGADMVIGNRFRGRISPGAMPFLHRYLGNPVLSLLGRLFFKCPVGDFNCGLRGVDAAALSRLDLRSMGMEFAIEMVAKASLAKFNITEIPTNLRPDGRARRPHLRTWSDGWRALRFMLLYSPKWLFLYPGLGLLLFGAVVIAGIVAGPVQLFGAQFDVHTMLVGMAAVILGSQIVLSFLLAYQYATTEGILPLSDRFRRFLDAKSLESSIILGGVSFTLGVLGVIASVIIWASVDFGELDYSRVMRIMIPAITGMILGVQLIAAGFLSSVLDIKGRRSS